MIPTSSSHVPYKTAQHIIGLYYSTFLLIHLYIQRLFHNINNMIIFRWSKNSQFQNMSIFLMFCKNKSFIYEWYL